MKEIKNLSNYADHFIEGSNLRILTMNNNSNSHESTQTTNATSVPRAEGVSTFTRVPLKKDPITLPNVTNAMGTSSMSF